MLTYLRLLLLPLSIIYGAIVFMRNKFYDWGIFKSVRFEKPIICVGNLAVGGSGKTPTTEYLVRLLKDYKVAILSRGYGRKTKGFILADGNSTAESIGDEPLQYYQKFNNISVAVCEERKSGIEQLVGNHDVIILDDAFQHRRVTAGLNLLLFEFSKIRAYQFWLPAGNLRDVFSSRKRAKAFLVTKSPKKLTEGLKEKSTLLLKPNSEQNVFHSYIQYGNLEHLYSELKMPLDNIEGYNIYLITGIANPKPLVKELEKYAKIINHYNYSDHYNFEVADVKNIQRLFLSDNASKKIIVTTEKDAKRLVSKELKSFTEDLPIFYIPIEFCFDGPDHRNFDNLILSYVRDHTRNS